MASHRFIVFHRHRGDAFVSLEIKDINGSFWTSVSSGEISKMDEWRQTELNADKSNFSNDECSWRRTTYVRQRNKNYDRTPKWNSIHTISPFLHVPNAIWCRLDSIHRTNKSSRARSEIFEHRSMPTLFVRLQFYFDTRNIKSISIVPFASVTIQNAPYFSQFTIFPLVFVSFFFLFFFVVISCNAFGSSQCAAKLIHRWPHIFRCRNMRIDFFNSILFFIFSRIFPSYRSHVSIVDDVTLFLVLHSKSHFVQMNRLQLWGHRIQWNGMRRRRSKMLKNAIKNRSNEIQCFALRRQMQTKKWK